MNQELVRIIDSICRDKNIDRDSLVADIEVAMTTAIRKHYEESEEAEVKIDMVNGSVKATVDGEPIDIRVLGRIAAQAAKQMIIQKTRDRERTSIYEDFSGRQGTIVTGTVIRAEGGNLLVNIGRSEGFLPRSEQIPGETHEPGERLRALILEVRDQPNQVKIILSRSHKDLIVRLFELEVPEVAEHVIEIRAIAREAGYRSKVAVTSIDSKVDAVGACVGVRGSRIKNIVDELGGEKIDIVRWNESSQILIQNALKPAEIEEVALCFELNKATVVVNEDQLSLAIGKRGQNVRLASRLTEWDVDILTPTEYSKHLENLEQTLKSVEGVDDVLIDKVIAFGCVSVMDIDEIGPEPLVKELEIEAELCERLVEACGEEAIRIEEEREAKAKAEAEAKAAGITPPSDKSEPSPEAKAPLSGAAGLDALMAGAVPAAPEGAETAEPAADVTPDEPTVETPAEPVAETPTVTPDEAVETPTEPAAEAQPEPAAESPSEPATEALGDPAMPEPPVGDAPTVASADDVPTMPSDTPTPPPTSEPVTEGESTDPETPA